MKRRAKLRMAAHVVEASLCSRIGLLRPPRFAHVALRVQDSARKWPELDLAGWTEVFQGLSCLDVVKIVGDDPFERPDFSELLGAVVRHVSPSLLQVGTPATDPQTVLQVVRDHAFSGLHLRVRVEGWGEQEASARETLDGLLMLQQRGSVFSLGVNFHLAPDNLEQAKEAQRFCERRGIGFFPGIPVHPVVFKKRPDQSGAEDVDDGCVHHLLDDLDRQKATRYPGLAGRLWTKANVRLAATLQCSGPNHAVPCQELRGLIYLAPDGSLVTCGQRWDPLVDLRTQDLRKDWSGAVIKEAREVVGGCQGCFQTSVQLASALYGGNWAA